MINAHLFQATNGRGSVEDDDDDWGSDSAEDGQQRIDELTDAAKKLMASEELEKSTEDRLEMFYKFVEACKQFVFGWL